MDDRKRTSFYDPEEDRRKSEAYQDYLDWCDEDWCGDDDGDESESEWERFCNGEYDAELSAKNEKADDAIRR